jgi:microcystin-dependent protein
MAEPYLGQIILVGFNFAPLGYELCHGQLLSIAQNDALFNLIGTTYGGDGQSTFALPDLRGRLPLGVGQGQGLQNYQLGEFGGVESVTLTSSQLAPHTHPIDTSSFTGTTACRKGPGNQQTPEQNVHAAEAAGATLPYSSASADQSMSADSVGAVTGNISMASAGGNAAHDNMQPTLTMNFCIAVGGVFPSQT